MTRPVRDYFPPFEKESNNESRMKSSRGPNHHLKGVSKESLTTGEGWFWFEAINSFVCWSAREVSDDESSWLSFRRAEHLFVSLPCGGSEILIVFHGTVLTLLNRSSSSPNNLQSSYQYLTSKEASSSSIFSVECFPPLVINPVAKQFVYICVVAELLPALKQW